MSGDADEPEPATTPADTGDTASGGRDPALPSFERYLEARDRGDDEAAAGHWDELIVMNYDRMRNKIAGLAGRGKADWLGEEIDDIAQEAFPRAQGMALTFRGRSLGQARAALVKTARHAALDAGRRRTRRQKDVAGSLDEQHTHEDGSTSERWEGLAADSEDWTERIALGSLELEEIGEALGEIPSEDQRTVLLMTWDGFESAEIAEAIGKSVNNVDQLRRRGLKALIGVLGHG